MNKEFIDKWQSQVKKGTLSFVVLLVLKENELYGYELIEKIKSLIKVTQKGDHVWKITFSSAEGVFVVFISSVVPFLFLSWQQLQRLVLFRNL